MVRLPLPDAALEEMERLADPGEALAGCILGVAARRTMFRPNKDELWLHWSLLDSRRARWAVLTAQAAARAPAGPRGCVHIPEQQLTWRIRFRSRWRYLNFARLARRASPARVAAHGLERLAMVRRRHRDSAPQYWRFFFAEGFFDFGMFVFFFLYNLYLLQLGFREKFLGLMSGVMTAGNVAGSILAVFAMRRFGIAQNSPGVVRTDGPGIRLSRA